MRKKPVGPQVLRPFAGAVGPRAAPHWARRGVWPPKGKGGAAARGIARTKSASTGHFFAATQNNRIEGRPNGLVRDQAASPPKTLAGRARRRPCNGARADDGGAEGPAVQRRVARRLGHASCRNYGAGGGRGAGAGGRSGEGVAGGRQGTADGKWWRGGVTKSNANNPWPKMIVGAWGSRHCGSCTRGR